MNPSSDMVIVISEERPILKFSGFEFEGWWNNVSIQTEEYPVAWFDTNLDFRKRFKFASISKFSGSDIPDNIHLFYIEYSNQIYNFIRDINISKIEGHLICHYWGYFKIDNWIYDISLIKFLSVFEDSLNSFNSVLSFELDFSDNVANVEVCIQLDSEVSLEESVHEGLNTIKLAHQISVEKNTNPDEFVTLFNFPEKYRHIFIQYLIYFGKFLEDIGLNSIVTVDNYNDDTVLKVLPTNQTEAIENIQSALALYLSLPSVAEFSITSINNSLESEVRIQQLLANIEHMKSQLMMAESTIKLQNTHIDILQKNKEILKVPSKEIIDYWQPFDWFRVKSYKGKFFDINIPLLVKKIRSLK